MRWPFHPRSPHQVTLYGKANCHLCEEAHALLVRLSRRYPLTLDEVDITSDPALFRRYDIRIPVIVIDRRLELEAPLDERKLRRALATSLPGDSAAR